MAPCYHTALMRFRGLAEATAVLTAALALACVLTYPYAFKFNHGGRVDTNDGRWSIWVVSWVAPIIVKWGRSRITTRAPAPWPTVIGSLRSSIAG